MRWVAAMDGSNDFNPIKLHWSLHPDRDQGWRDNQTKLMGEKEAAQECDCDFISSGRSVIDAELVEWYKINTYQGNFWKYGRLYAG